MDHLLLAIQGTSTSFPRIAEDLIREKFPRTFRFKVKVPVIGKGTRQVTVTLETVPHRVGVTIENDGYIYTHLEIKVSLAAIDHDLLLNDIFVPGQPIPTTSVPMATVPPMPLAHKFNPPKLIGVPRIDVRIARTTQTMLEGKKLRLNAQIEPGQIFIDPLNLAGLLQVLSHHFISGITEAINGAYGHSFLAEILAAVLNFLDILLQHVLEILKIPESIFAALVTHLAAAIKGALLEHWSPTEVPMVVVPRVVTIAPAVQLPDGRTKAAVELLIASMAARTNIVGQPPDVTKEFIGSIGFVE
jgi:hypothetical protein